MQPTGCQTLSPQLRLVLTEKLGHTLPLLLLTARCDWKEAKPLKPVEIDVTDYLAETAGAASAVCAAVRAGGPPLPGARPRGRPAAPARRGAPSQGPSSLPRGLPHSHPRTLPEGPFPPGTAAPGARSRLRALTASPAQLLQMGTPLPESSGGGAGRRGARLRPPWEPLRPSPTFPEAEAAAAGAAHRVPGQGDSPCP